MTLLSKIKAIFSGIPHNSIEPLWTPDTWSMSVPVFGPGDKAPTYTLYDLHKLIDDKFVPARVHDARVTELLQANAAEVLRRRAAEANLAALLERFPLVDPND